MAQSGAAYRNSRPPSLRQLGKYQLLTHLGSGGMADVYLATQRGTSRFTKLVVLKALREPELDADSDADAESARRDWVRMFSSEAMLAARLNHPNVVQTLEAGEQGDRHVIVMEHLDGRSLQNIEDREAELHTRLPLAARVRILADALAGLHYAHELADFDGVPLGVVHRDVSPQNIFVCFDGRVKVLDFGIAKLALPSQHTETGVLKGKVRYMSPEQALGESVERATDIFALGVVLWEALAERSLWLNKNEMQVLQVLLNQDPLPALREANPAVPERLADACMKALSYDPAQRFGTCAEFRAELLAFLEERPNRISNEEIGRSVSGMFAAFREAQQQAISQQLRAFETSRPPLESSPPPVSEERTRRRPRTRSWWLPAGVLLMTLSAGAYDYFFENGALLERVISRMTSASVTASARAPLQLAVPVPPSPAVATTVEAEASAVAASTTSNTPDYTAPPTPNPSPKVANIARRSPARNKAGASENSASPPAAGPPAAVKAPRSRIQLDTDNPWSSGANAKP